MEFEKRLGYPGFDANTSIHQTRSHAGNLVLSADISVPYLALPQW
jgi:hypothetical protein